MRISDWSSDVCSSDLRLPEKLLGLTNLRLKLLERGKWQAGEVFRFVDQRRRLVLERLDLIVDLLERAGRRQRSEEHTSELQSLMRISYAVFCLKKKTHANRRTSNNKTSTVKYHDNTYYHERDTYRLISR